MSMIMTDKTLQFKSKALIAEEFNKFGVHEDRIVY